MFQNQQNSARGGPLAGSRLQNGKLGELRTLNVGDDREFPSLSGAPQAQQNTSAQQMWSNPTLRTTQHSTIQRPQGQSTQQGQAGQAANQQLNQTHDDGVSTAPSQFSGGGDDYRFGGQSGVGQLSGASQPQTGNIDEFPPLGGSSVDVGPDRRTGMIQNAAAYGSNANANAFPGLGQTRNGLSSPIDAQQDRVINSALGGRGLNAVTASRTPFENMRGSSGTPTGLTDSNARAGQTLGNIQNMSFMGSTPPNLPPVGQRPQQNQFEPAFGADNVGSPNAQAPHKKLAEMTEAERYTLPGLLSMIPLESPDYSSLAVGQDLTVLGLDLSRPDNSPLHPTFGSPFMESNAKPVIPVDFKLPAAYTVTNVPPLMSKMSSFSAETLLAIFYQFPRDLMQEIAAHELYNRDWRWHTKLQQWMMKDPDLPAPQRLTPKVERGWYLFFDVTNWRRERREFELDYDHLDQRHGRADMAGPV
ncbi:transcriptional regulator [Kalmusia sp. IMI 367209]|nr:transcriptional regulator [Kalmusia sp. IMI 367209]